MPNFWEIEGNESCDRPLRWLFLEGIFNCKYEVIGEFDGTAGTILTLAIGKDRQPPYLIAKLPKILSDTDPEAIREKVRRFLHEINETYRYSHHPLISHHAEVRLCYGLPVVLSRKAEFTLRDLIESGPVAPVEAAQIVVQIAHALEYCSIKGLTAHQDLKPENVLVDRLADKVTLPEEESRYPLDHRIFICDFGMANAFGAFGLPCGSRPYMAPEQYRPSGGLAKSDVFALGVVLHELLTGGLHPIGAFTHDVWPKPLESLPKKWGHEDVWRKWAFSNKTIDAKRCPSELSDAIKGCLQVDVAARSTPIVLKTRLLEYICIENRLMYQNLMLLLSYFDKWASDSEITGWPYYEQLLDRVNSHD